MANKRPKNQLTSYSQRQSLSNRRRTIKQRGIAGVMIAFMFLGGYLVISPILSNSSDLTTAFSWPWQKSTPKTSTAPKASNNYTVQVSDPAPSSGRPAVPAQKPGTLVVDDPVTPGKIGIKTNDTCWLDHTSFPHSRSAPNLVSRCKTEMPKVEQIMGSPPVGRPIVIIMAAFKFQDNHHAYLGTFACRQFAGCVKGGTGNQMSAVYIDVYYIDGPVLTHELAHKTQNHAGPLWFKEGSANYTAHMLGYSGLNANFGCQGHEDYSAGYACGAALLKYITRAYNSNAVKLLNGGMLSGKTSDQIIDTITGKSFQTLYKECLNAECRGGASLINGHPQKNDNGGPYGSKTRVERSNPNSGSSGRGPSKNPICPKTTGVTALGEFMYTRLTGLVGR